MNNIDQVREQQDQKEYDEMWDLENMDLNDDFEDSLPLTEEDE